MSIVEFKKSITPDKLFKWKVTMGATITEELITIYPGGCIEHTFIPLSSEDKFITTKYRLIIKYKKNDQMIDNGITCLFDLIMLYEDDEKVKHQVIGVRALSNDNSGISDVIFNSSGGYADNFKFRLRNHGDSDVEIESIELFPSYRLDDDTITIVQQMLPTLTHASNLNSIGVSQNEILLTRVKASTTEDTSLSIHGLINGWCSEDTTATIRILMNETALSFSPIRIDITRGNFLIAIPACVLRVKSGGNELKVLMNVSSGHVSIEPEKVQFSLEGKGLIQGGGAARPGASVTERYKLNMINSNEKLIVRNGNVDIQIQKPKEIFTVETNNLIDIKDYNSLVVTSNFDIELNHRI